MQPLITLINRLKKIGIEIELLGNFPWVYLDKVNGNKITNKHYSIHKFTIGYTPIKSNNKFKFTDLRIIFNEIRNNL